ncbi:MAG: hypothetical protein FWG98_15430 [Candidatus Cloacimonetes bacterium]|nr:hypothetical protein [Candidatus Cloacimonadota bacterium]
MICVKSCPVTAIYKKNKKLYITPKKCIKCFCCHEMCPLGMIELKRTIVAKLLFFRRRK